MTASVGRTRRPRPSVEGSVFKVRLPVEAEDPRKLGHILVSMH